MQDDDEIIDNLWYSTEGGRNIGQLGIENGYILRDEELGNPEEPEDAEARITLEQGRVENPGFFVTAQLYGGWLFLTVRNENQSQSEALYDTLRAELERLSGLLPYEGERDIAIRAAKVAAECVALEAHYTNV